MPPETQITEMPLANGGVRLSLGSAGHDRAGARAPARIIVPVWGDRYLDDLLSITIPALLAPGNLPAFSEHFFCELAIVTERRLFDLISVSPSILRVLQHADVRLIPIDDLLSSWYGITLTYALVRGFSDLGPKITDTHLVFLNADFILADGSYRTLAKRILAGERLVVSPSYCMVLEKTLPQLRARLEPTNGALAVPPREMAAMIINYRHNTIRAKTVNQRLFRIHRYDQFYWYVNRNVLLARQMPIAVIYMRPERALVEMPTFWDYGVISEYCPTVTPCVLGDSDDFLMAELRTETTFCELLHLGWPSAAAIAADLSSFTTRDHHDYGRHTLILHSADLPERLDEQSRQLAHFVDQVYAQLSPPVSYRNHPFWASAFPRFQAAQKAQLARFNAYLLAENSLIEEPSGQADAARLAATKSELRRIERDHTDAVRHGPPQPADSAYARSADDPPPDIAAAAPVAAASDYAKLRQRLRREIDDLADARERAVEQRLAPLTPTELKSVDQATAEELEPQNTTERLRAWLAVAQPIYEKFFGRLPTITNSHPLKPTLRHVIDALDRHRTAKEVLIVASGGLFAAPLTRRLTGRKLTTSPELAKQHTSYVFDCGRTFDLLFCDFSYEDLFQCREILSAVEPLLAPNGRIVVFYRHERLGPLDDDTFALTKSLFPIIGRSSVKYTGSFLGFHIARGFMRLTSRYDVLNFTSHLILACGLFMIAPVARWALARERKANPEIFPNWCTSLTMEIELD